MPKLVTKDATLATFDGEKLNPALRFKYSYYEIGDNECDSMKPALAALEYPVFEGEAAIDAKEKLSAKDLVSVLNSTRSAKERARRQAEELEANGIKRKELGDNPRARALMIFKACTVGAKPMSAETANAMARSGVPEYDGPDFTIE